MIPACLVESTLTVLAETVTPLVLPIPPAAGVVQADGA